MSKKLKLKQNAIFIPSKNEYIVSTNVHDFKTYMHADGRSIFIDGGNEYFRTGGDLNLFTSNIVERFSLHGDEKFNVIVEKALWGTRGKEGDKPLTFRPIKELTREHLRAIKRNCGDYMHPTLLKVVKYWLKTKYNE